MKARVDRGLVFFAIVALASGWRFFRLRYWREFSDEGDTIVIGWLVSEGESIYRTVFSHHMPFAYVLAHLVAVLSPTDHVAHFRLVTWLAYLAVGAALTVPAGSSPARPVAGAIFLSASALVLPLFNGQMLLAEPIWGALFALFVVKLLLPALFGEPVSAKSAALGGAALALSLATSLAAVYPFAVGLAVVAVVVSSSPEARREAAARAGPFLVAFLGAGLVVLLWVKRFGSVLGLFEEAVLFNFQVYARYNGEGTSAISLAAQAVKGFVATLFASLCRPERLADPRSAFVALAVVASVGAAAAVRRAKRPRLLQVAAFPLSLLFVVALRVRDAEFRAIP
ncbi:MAG TPA: hypothetical protein VGR00_04500, partial [Thermoanaerobaculia bacterium]|nr:hypothetical protein [Thermoanaerobaculia bacterium]